MSAGSLGKARRPPVRRPAPQSGSGGRREAVAIVAVAGLSGLTWVAGGCATLVAGHGWHEVSPAASLGLLIGLLGHPRTPAAAWPRAIRRLLPPASVLWLVLVTVGAGCGVATWTTARLVRHRRKPAPARAPTGAAWAGRADLRALAVRRPGGGRLVVGRAGATLVAVEAGQSLLVAGPTQSGKTTGLAIPAILEWEGPVIATSVKTDLVRETAPRREMLGPVLVYDPSGVTGGRRADWSPLAEARDWAGARRVAAGFAAVQRSGGAPEDAAFWLALAEKMLAPMLLAAASSARTMADVVRWVDSGEVGEVLDALESAGQAEALRAAQASFSREERQLSSVYATVETLVAGFADPVVAASAANHDITAARLTDGGATTVYLVAPSHEQERLRPVFVAVLRCLLEGAITKASREGRLDPPLLVVADEAANIAPLSDLDTLAATASSHGIQLVTVWQDFAQIEARYGPRAATVVNNHRAKLVCSGIADPATLEQVSRLIGDEERSVETLTVDRAGAASSTSSPSDRRLAPAAWLRRISPGEAVLVYGHLPPVRVTLRPYFAERRWRGQAGSPAPGCGGRRRSHLRRPSWRWRRRIATVRGDGVAEPRRTGQVPVASSAPCGPGAGGEDLSGKPF